MARSGLRKVTKTVRGKKGTVRRTYWVKSADTGAGRMSLGQFARKHGKMWVGSNLATGAIGGSSAYMAARHGRRLGGDAASRAIVGHAVGGIGSAAVIGRSKRLRALEQAYRRMGFGAKVATQAVGTLSHMAGMVGGAVATHKAHSIFGRNRKSNAPVRR